MYIWIEHVTLYMHTHILTHMNNKLYKENGIQKTEQYKNYDIHIIPLKFFVAYTAAVRQKSNLHAIYITRCGMFF